MTGLVSGGVTQGYRAEAWLAATFLFLVLSSLACSPPAPPATEGAPAPDPDVEATSLLGRQLRRPVLDDDRRLELERNLEAARANYELDPLSEDNIVWLGRRLSYLSRYREAIEVYSRGLELHPDSYKLLRHRGHRFITLRRFDDAVVDLERAARLAAAHEDEVEPDGVPNAIGVPLSTTRFNIWYHLGLAHFLKADYDRALDAYRDCLAVSTNPDLLVATTDWMYMTLRRLGRDNEAIELLAPVAADMEIVENDAYHQRLLMYRGELDPKALLDLDANSTDANSTDANSTDPDFTDPDLALQLATQGYGVGNWYLVEGDVERAFQVFERILEGSSWAAFGYIAAEADVARRHASSGGTEQ